ncbi:MAG: hypothetical protein ACI83D_000109 [Planctomycetota bacterium]|jgi:hypothetical protein
MPWGQVSHECQGMFSVSLQFCFDPQVLLQYNIAGIHIICVSFWFRDGYRDSI